MKSKFLVFIGCFILSGIFAQQERYSTHFRSLSVEDGLSHRVVYCVHQDSEGFMWFGTESGLNRFDGYTFSKWTKAKGGLFSDRIHMIFEDAEGYFWMADRAVYHDKSPLKSLQLFHPQTEESVSFEEKFGEQAPFHPSDIIHLSQTDGQHILLLEKAKSWTYHPAEGFKQLFWADGMQLIRWINKDEIWLKNAHDSLICTDESGRIKASLGLGKNKAVNDLIRQQAGDSSILWILQPPEGTESGEFRRIGPDSDTRFVVNKNSPFPGPTNISRVAVRASDQSLWYTENKSIWVLDSQGKYLWGNPEIQGEEAARKVNQLFFDREELAWLVTDEGILMMHFKKNPFTLYLDRETAKWDIGKASTGVRGIIEINGQLLINRYTRSSRIDLATGMGQNTYEGLPPFDTKDRRRRAAEDLLGGYRVPLLLDSKGRLWTAAEGLLRLDTEGNEVQAFPLNEGTLTAWALFEDKNERIWLGLNQGLAVFDETKKPALQLFDAYNEHTSLQKAHVICFYTDREGIIWVCSNTGLYVLDLQKGITQKYAASEEGKYHLPASNFYHMHQDAQGVYWLATADAGLIRWEPQASQKPIRQFTQDHGLPSNTLYAIYEDDFNHLWMGSDYGLIQFNKEDFTLRSFFPEDGISSYEFNRTSHYQAPDGRLYMGTITGVNAFYPQAFYRDKNDEQALVISSFKQYIEDEDLLRDLTKKLKQDREIVFSPTDRFCSIQIALQDYFFSPKVKYEYKIEGLYDVWQKMQGNELLLSGLPYGKYQLKLRARGSDGSYAPQQISLALIVKKPFYLKTAFLISAAIALLLGIWLLLRFRTLQLQRQKKVLEDMVGKRTRQIEQDKKTIEKQAAELQELDKLKTRFFTHISHELRTPITLILGPVQQLIQKAAGKFSKEMLDPLFMIRKNGQSLLQLTEELLELAKLESGQVSLDLQPTDFQFFCQQIFSTFQLQAEFKKITYRMVYKLERPLFLEIDENSLGKILTNLLSNALKFSSSGGEVIFEIRREAGHFLLAVRDKGPGIAEEDLPHVFDRFFQSKKRQASHKGGSGIGLALSKELALLMKGELAVESREGEGSRFYLRFPAREVESISRLAESQEVFWVKKEEALKGEITATPPNAEKRHILIVEDNADIQQFLRSMLENAYHITAAFDGQEGWEYLENQAPGALPVSLILSDIMMPRMDGYALLEKVKSHPIHRQLPVIMLTARAAEKDKLTALRMGVDDYLTKPFSPEELQARLQNLLHNYQQRQAFQQENELLQKLEEQAPEPVDDAWLQQLEQLILDTLDKGMSPLVSDLASHMATSERQLLRRVKSLTGLSIKDYSQEVKLQKARILLEKKSFGTIAEVAYSSGFNTPAYFSKVFEKRFGKRPSAYLSPTY